MKEYAVLREEFLGKNDECKIQSPVCTFSALVIHHTNGRENERLLEVQYWMASCPGCNIWIEANDAWARERKVKLYKHRINN